jgi:hypothetical protein
MRSRTIAGGWSVTSTSAGSDRRSLGDKGRAAGTSAVAAVTPGLSKTRLDEHPAEARAASSAATVKPAVAAERVRGFIATGQARARARP